ncbi:hypothetical protein MKY96_33745 [Paenibacillus sp. FSL R7-0302]|uniref:hypothetical protein n=1 Tax=Paenibacillus sp. FSL R7-0302 TaxID=2921681 RepID=UPI0030F69D1C
MSIAIMRPALPDEIQQAIQNLCDADYPTRAANVEVGFLDLVYRALIVESVQNA